MRTNSNLTVDNQSNKDKDSSTKVVFGAGASYNFTKEIAGVIDYTAYTLDAPFLSVGVRYGF